MGQALNYIENLASAQRWRRKFTALVSNLHSNRFLQYWPARNGGDRRMVTFPACDFVTAMQFLNDILKDDEEQPESPRYSSDLGVITAHLGSTNTSTVASFKYPLKQSENMAWISPEFGAGEHSLVAVKHRRQPPQATNGSLKSEIDLLKRIQTLGGSHYYLPCIQFHDMNLLEFGVVPVGERINPKELNDHSQQSKIILSDVLAALVWLHEQHIIHRDVRWDNIVEHNNHGYLIDFGSAVLANSPGKRKYAGGYICCPPRILNSKRGLEEEYTPSKIDDYHAYVLLVNTLVFPASTAGFESRRIEQPHSDEMQRLQSLWRKLERSKVWGGLLKQQKTAIRRC
ncbi:hypothetical protein K440DRAFT_630993 [Wilcoxina mikolae CBS 423.85]|nr:hypothetical protein K440DRAFT_630993 [Wilcoxina mikolae CBS 423.85]